MSAPENPFHAATHHNRDESHGNLEPAALNRVTHDHHPQDQSTPTSIRGTERALLAALSTSLNFPLSATPDTRKANSQSWATPTGPAFTRIAHNNSLEIDTNSPSWKAAHEAIVSQMVTSQDIMTPSTVPKAKPKTGGRRGRGGRRSAVKAHQQEPPAHGLVNDSSAVAGGEVAGSASGKGQGKGRAGRPRARPSGTPRKGTKRKRNQSDDEDDAGKDDTDASETFTPLPAQSRSGRRIFKANTFSPVVIDLEAPPSTKSKAGASKVGRKGSQRSRQKGDASVCKNCGRGHSPPSNMIVFCDGCNTPWHQFCHDRPISREVVQIEEREWLCTDCEVLKEERVHLEGSVAAPGMNLAEKRRYLQTLSPSRLISLLLNATTLHPHLPIYSRQPVPPASEFSRHLQSDAPVADTTANDNVYEPSTEPDYLPYPKAGNGVPLPPEKDDLAFLVDDDVVTFSHCLHWDRQKLHGSGVAWGDVEMGWEQSLVGVSA